MLPKDSIRPLKSEEMDCATAVFLLKTVCFSLKEHSFFVVLKEEMFLVIAPHWTSILPRIKPTVDRSNESRYYMYHIQRKLELKPPQSSGVISEMTHPAGAMYFGMLLITIAVKSESKCY